MPGLYDMVARNVMVGSGFPAAWPTATNSLADQRLRVVFADGTWVER